MTHTPEPWPEPELIEYDKEISWWRIPSVGDFTDNTDAERARACVNACAGIADVSVVPMMAALIEEIDRDPGDTDVRRGLMRMIANKLKGGTPDKNTRKVVE